MQQSSTTRILIMAMSLGLSMLQNTVATDSAMHSATNTKRRYTPYAKHSGPQLDTQAALQHWPMALAPSSLLTTAMALGKLG